MLIAQKLDVVVSMLSKRSYGQLGGSFPPETHVTALNTIPPPEKKGGVLHKKTKIKYKKRGGAKFPTTQRHIPKDHKMGANYAEVVLEV